MSSEPQRPIEKLLRTCAEQKRAQAGEKWELHPATRRLLQQEVSQQLRNKSESASTWFSWWQGLRWLRPLAALGVLAVIAAGTWVMLQRSSAQKNELLAKNELPGRQLGAGPVPPPPLTQVVSQSSSPPSASRLSLLQDNGRPESRQSAAALQETELTKALPQKAPESPVAVGQSIGGPADQSPVPSYAPAANLAASEKQAAQSFAPAAPAATPQRYALESGAQPAVPTLAQTWTRTAAANAPALSAKAASGELSTLQSVPVAAQATAQAQLMEEGLPAGIVDYGYFAVSPTPNREPLSRQMVRRTDALAGNAGGIAWAPKGILASFRVEQAAGQMRIIDADGSVYSGPIQATNLVLSGASNPASAGGLELPGATATRDLKTAQPPLAQYFFQVVGTNRSSKQPVSFSGALDLDTNGLPVLASPPAEVTAGRKVIDHLRQDRSSAPASALLQNFRVSGKVVVGGNAPYPMEALRVSPQPSNQ